MIPRYRLYNPFADVIRVLDRALIVCFGHGVNGEVAMFVKPKLFNWILDPDAFDNLYAAAQRHFTCQFTPHGWLRCDNVKSERFAEQLVVDTLFSSLRFKRFSPLHRACLRYPLFSVLSFSFLNKLQEDEGLTIDDKHIATLAEAAFAPETQAREMETHLHRRLRAMYKPILSACLEQARAARATARHLAHQQGFKARM